MASLAFLLLVLLVLAQFALASGPALPILSAGLSHTMAIVDGKLYCWGKNDKGQCGLGNNINPISTAHEVTSVSSPLAVASGFNFGCVVDGTTLKCMGRGNKFQLGQGTTADSNTPLSVSIGGDAVSAAAGSNHVCVVNDAKDLYCWGQNTNGQLGTGDLVDVTTPTKIKTFVLKAAASVKNTCILKPSGLIKCTGANDVGQLGKVGPDSTTYSNIDNTNGPASAIDVWCGRRHCCGLDSTSQPFCWGEGNDGQIGQGTTSNQFVPLAVPGLGAGSMTVFGIGYGDSTCAVRTDTSLTCFGENANGALGLGTTTNVLSPVNNAFAGLTGVIAASGGDGFMCVLTNDDKGYCSGKDNLGQLGNGGDPDTTTPDEVVGLGTSAPTVQPTLLPTAQPTKLPTSMTPTKLPTSLSPTGTMAQFCPLVCAMYAGDPHLMRRVVGCDDQESIIPVQHCDGVYSNHLFANAPTWSVEVNQDQANFGGSHPTSISAVMVKNGGTTLTFNGSPFPSSSGSLVVSNEVSSSTIESATVTLPGSDVIVHIYRYDFTGGYSMTVNVCSAEMASGIAVDGCAPGDVVNPTPSPVAECAGFDEPWKTNCEIDAQGASGDKLTAIVLQTTTDKDNAPAFVTEVALK